MRREHEEFRLKVREFAEKYLAPRVEEIEESNEIPEELFDRAAEEGFYGVGIPEEYGGRGADQLMLAIMVEELARVCPAFGMMLIVHHLFTIPILLHGSEEQKKTYIESVAHGLKHAAHAVTEPGAGSDLAGIETRARREGGEWVIDGVKSFITGAEQADYIIVLARTDSPSSESERGKGLTFFVVERGDEGLEVAGRNEVVGMRGAHISNLKLENVKVSDSRRVGGEGKGFRIALETYGRARIGAAALGVGAAQALLERSLTYALNRKAFGKPIISFQAIGFTLADMFVELEAARLMLYWAASLSNKGSEDAAVVASMAKLHASKVAERAALKAVEIHGRLGVSRGGVERFLRDAEVMKIIEGTEEIQRIIISKYLSKAAQRKLR